MNLIVGLPSLVLATCLVTGCATQSRIVQPPRDLPAYGGACELQKATRLAVYPYLDIGDRLLERLKAKGCTIVSSVPTTGSMHPDLIVETVRCAQDTERDGEEVSLVTVLVLRVRKPGVLSKDSKSMSGMSGMRTFQGVSRIPLGRRAFNDENITEQELAQGVEKSLDNLMRIEAFLTALEGGRK